MFGTSCAPRSSLDNPSFRPSNQQTTFLVQDYGELEGSTGYWAAEEETGQESLVQEFEDIFWTHDEVVDDWIARRFTGARRLTKGPRKGRRKGAKGGKGAHFCSVYERAAQQTKGKSKRKVEGSKKEK